MVKLSSSVEEQWSPCACECQVGVMGGGGRKRVPGDRTSPVACDDTPRMPMDGTFTNASIAPCLMTARRSTLLHLSFRRLMTPIYAYVVVILITLLACLERILSHLAARD